MIAAARTADQTQQTKESVPEGADWPTTPFIFVATLAALLSIDLGEHRWPALEPVRLIVFIGLAVAGSLAVRTVRRDTVGRADVAVVASLGWVAVVSVLAVDPVEATVVAAALLGTYVIGASVVNVFSSSDHLWAALAAGTAPPLLIAAALGAPPDDTRWIGLAEEPNGLAVTAALAVVLGVVVCRRHWGGWGVAMLGVATLVATNSVLPGCAALAGAAVWVSASWPPLIRRVAASIVGIGAAAVVLAIFWLPVDSLPGDGYNLETVNERTGIWSYLLDATSDAPVLGHGARATHDIMDLGAFDQRVHFGPTHGHGAWIELAIAGGWPAAVLFVIGLALALGRAERNKDSARSALLVCLGLLAVTEPLLREPTTAVLVMGAAVAAPQVVRSKEL